MKVLLADRNIAFRTGLRAFLETTPEITIIGEASDGLMAIRMARSLKPDVLVSEVHLPKTNGIIAAKKIHKISPSTNIILLCSVKHVIFSLPAVAVGASSYMLKSSTLEDVKSEILAVANMPPASEFNSDDRLARMKKNLPPDIFADEIEVNRETGLTMRDLQVLQMKAEGVMERDIARYLNVARRVVEMRIESISHKLGIHGMANLVSYATYVGIVAPPDIERDDDTMRKLLTLPFEVAS